MSRSRLGWAACAIAPWALGIGLLVSLAARADPDPETGGLTLPVREAALDVQISGGAKLIEARFVVGGREDLGAVPDEIEPRFARKTFKFAAPVINRAHRGDPFIPLRPGFEARARARQMNFEPNPARVEPVRVAFSDGAAPSVPLAFALASASPQPSEGRLAAALAKAPAVALAVPGFVAAPTDLSDRPGYATLIDPKDAARQMRCLAEAIYFEARSEPEGGQAAVAQVVLNRVRSGIYPATVCGVVYQDRQRPFACQFSFACEGKSLRVEEAGPWATATRIAEGVAKGAITDAKYASAINYHAAYVRPFWAPTLKKIDRIGLHVFYAMRPGLYWAPGALNGRGDLPPLIAQAAPGPQAALTPLTKTP